jgi:hypothetical protein
VWRIFHAARRDEENHRNLLLGLPETEDGASRTVRDSDRGSGTQSRGESQMKQGPPKIKYGKMKVKTRNPRRSRDCRMKAVPSPDIGILDYLLHNHEVDSGGGRETD